VTSVRSSLSDVIPARLARSWREVEPDSNHRREIAAALAEGKLWISELFGQRLTLGPSGIHGRLGPGPGAMNRVLMRLVAAGLAEFADAHGASHVVLGRDGHDVSATFATDMAKVLAARRTQVLLITPSVSASLVRSVVSHFDADAGVMITTAGQNSAENGCTIFGAGGAPLSASHIAELNERIASIALIADEELARMGHVRIRHIDSEVVHVDAATSGSLAC